MNNFYLIAVNSNYPFNFQAFHQYISQVLYPLHIASWWHYLPGAMYIVATPLNENQIYNLIIPHTGNRHILVVKIDPQQAQGWLPTEAWTWLGRQI